MRKFLLALQHSVELIVIGMDVWGRLPFQLEEVVLLAYAFVDLVDVLHSNAQSCLYSLALISDA